MHDMDLIPADYRERLAITTRLRVFTVFYTLLAAGLAAGFYGLQYRTGHIEAAIEKLRQGKQLTLQKQLTFDTVQQQKTDLQRRLNILSGLRGGPPAEHMFVTLDQILDRSVWFTEWTFLRAGEWSEVVPEGVRTGYIIVMPRENSRDREQAWKLSTHMEIRGQAGDHTRLAEFVNRLILRPEIDDVKVLNTNLLSQQNSSVVDFNLIIIVNSEFQASI